MKKETYTIKEPIMQKVGEKEVVHTKYIAEDGKEFSDEHECLIYENNIKEQAEKRELEDYNNYIKDADITFETVPFYSGYIASDDQAYKIHNAKELRDFIFKKATYRSGNYKQVIYDNFIEHVESFPVWVSIDDKYDGFAFVNISNGLKDLYEDLVTCKKYLGENYETIN